jgi:hypothetical protein
MAVETTPYLGLKKPDGTENVRITDLNFNADALDAKLQSVDNAIADIDVVGTIKEALVTPWGAKGLLCNGADFNAAAYPALAAIIPDTPSRNNTKSAGTHSGKGEIVKYGSYYVRLHNGGAGIVYTTDPEGAWTYVAITGLNSATRLRIVNGYATVVGSNASNYNAVFYTTDITISGWSSSAVLAATGRYIYDICYGNGYYYTYLINANAINVYYSSNLASWSAGAIYSATVVSLGSDLAYGNGFIVITHNGPSSTLAAFYATEANARTNSTQSTSFSIVSVTNQGAPSGIIYKDSRWAILYHLNLPDSTAPYGNALVVKTSNTADPSAGWTDRILYTGSGIVGENGTLVKGGSLSMWDGIAYVVSYFYVADAYTALVFACGDISTKLWVQYDVNLPVGTMTIAKTATKFALAPVGASAYVYSGYSKHLPLLSPLGAYAYIKALP